MTQRIHRSRPWRRITLSATVTLLTLVLLEGVLQLGSLVQYFSSRPPEAVTPGSGDVVLCVGDSWTHGMGTSDSTKFSYPVVLQDLLRKRTGHEWHVINGGQSGQNSRDVLLRLPSQLEQFKPRFVLVLVGLNDFWSRPDLVVDDTGYENFAAYRFRWRLPRLVAWATGALRTEGSTESAASTRTRGSEWETRPQPSPWYYPEEPAFGRRDPANDADRVDAWRLSSLRKYAEAATVFRRVLEREADNPDLYHGLHHALVRNGEMAEAQEALDWLQETWSSTHSYYAGRVLVFALDCAGKLAEVKDVAAQFLEKWPEDASVRAKLASAHFQLGEHELAYASILRSQERLLSTETYWTRCTAEFATRRLEEAMRSAFACYVATNDEKWLDGRISIHLDLVPTATTGFREVLAALECAEDVRARMSEILEGCIAAKDGKSQERILRAHWTSVAAHCAKQGAQPIYLTYPVASVFGRHCVEFAKEHGLPFIDVENTFVEKVGRERTHALRSADRHVTDEGYRLMAEFVADELVPMLTAGR